MQRILVMGSSGSGKSTFAQRLSAITDIPMVSVDALFWRPGWVEPDRAEFRGLLAEAAPPPGWIMDGNYLWRLGESRRDACDPVICFDLPRWICMLRIIGR